MPLRKINIIILSLVVIVTIVAAFSLLKFSNFHNYKIGDPVDSLNGVIVYYNCDVSNVSGRSITADKYNLGKKYQCVEFVKRYYYQHLNHKMPDSYGHAKDFFDTKIKDGSLNKKRNLTQYTNPSMSMPKADDLIVFAGTAFNKYGHVAIVSKVSNSEIEIIQQNPGPNGNSRVSFSLVNENNKWKVDNSRVLGWLRKE